MAEKTRFYSFVLRVYDSPALWESELAKLANHYAYIKHDRDLTKDGKLVEPHWHIVVTLARERSILNLHKRLRLVQQSNIQPCKDLELAFDYLTHVHDDDKVKYGRSEIVSNNIDWWDKSPMIQEESNREFLTDLFTLSDLDMAIRYGRDWIKNYNSYTLFRTVIYGQMLNSDQSDNEKILEEIKIFKG